MKKITLKRLAATPLVAYFEDSPCVRLPGWQIKEQADPNIPVGVVSVGQGHDHTSPWPAAHARLFKAAPKLLKLALAVDDAFSTNGEFNTFLSKHGTVELKQLAREVLREVRGTKGKPVVVV